MARRPSADQPVRTRSLASTASECKNRGKLGPTESITAPSPGELSVRDDLLLPQQENPDIQGGILYHHQKADRGQLSAMNNTIRARNR